MSDAPGAAEASRRPAAMRMRRGRRAPRRLYVAAGIGLFLLCIALRLPFLDRHGLWADELFSLAMATGHSLEHPADVADASEGDFVELPQAVAPDFYARHLDHAPPYAGPARVVRAVFLSDTSPPGYYVLLHFWTRVAGTSEVSLRLLSLLWALAALPVIWQVARQLGGRWAAMATGFIYAVSPLCVFYSTEGRMYSQLWFWSACLLWLTLRLHRQPAGVAWMLAGWIVVGTAGFLTHYFFAFVWGAAFLWLAIHPGRLHRGWLLLGAAVTVGLILPWYLRIPASLANWRITGDWLNDRDERLNLLRQVLQLPWQFFTPRNIWGLRDRWDIAALALFAVLVALAWRRVRWCSREHQLIWLTLAAACLGPVVFDLLRGTWVMLVPRYAIAALPAAFVLLGIALGRLRPLSRIVVSVAFLGLCGLGLLRAHLNQGRSFEPMQLIGQHVARDAQPGEVVIIHSIPSGVIGMARYIEQATPPGTPPPATAAWVGQLGRREMPRDLFELLEGRPRVTLVLVHEVGEPAPQLDWLLENATLDGERRVEAIRVYSFIPRQGLRFQAPP